MLHGKPVNPTLSPTERIKRIADGFKFYAWLYRFLSFIFLFLAPVLLALNVADNSIASAYWASASFLAGMYLWCVSGLGYAGAKVYGTDKVQGTASLVAFMVMIVAFLSMFVAVASVVAQHSSWLAPLPNLVGTSTLFAFGVGSYMIEIMYLVTEPQT
jgi:hypothetical protein